MGTFSYSTFFAGMKTAVFVFFILFTQTACPDNPTETECGENQIDVNGTCECAEGYHWNEDQTQCNMDTTSHNFVWEIDTLGNYGSYLNDVAIIDENNVWVVGNIETDSGSFNAAHWDGSEWELIKVLFRLEYEGGTVIWTDQIAISSVFEIENTVWFVAGGLTRYKDGEWYQYEIPWPNAPGSGGLWGSSSSNLYFVGGNGSIVHYDGVSFTRMESGTALNLLDIYGNDGNVYTTGHSNGHESVALEYDGAQWTTKFLSESLLPGDGTNFLGRIYSVWVNRDTVYVVAKGGIWKESLSTGEGILLSPSELQVTDQVTKRIRGDGYNDIFLADIWGDMIHYNGSTWTLDQTIYTQYPGGQIIIKSMDFIGDVCVAVGYMGSNAVIVGGKRVD